MAAYDNKLARIKDLKRVTDRVKVVEDKLTTETWTFELEDGSTVTREVAAWTSQVSQD